MLYAYQCPGLWAAWFGDTNNHCCGEASTGGNTSTGLQVHVCVLAYEVNSVLDQIGI